MITRYPDSYTGYIRLAESACIHDPKVALLAFAQAIIRDLSLVPAVSAKMRKLKHFASYGPAINTDESKISQL